LIRNRARIGVTFAVTITNGDRGQLDCADVAMIDHVSVGVANLARSQRFYDAALQPLGLIRTVNFGRGSEYGDAPGSPGVRFTITQERTAVAPATGSHICFRAPSREAVRAFFTAGLGSGGRSDGEPGLRSYHADYYAAFLLDPDGHRIEAVCHAPDQPSLAEG
jgi:catechol 2,3-dioxygenase-like lactoylglutathione lyase family enzyme